MKEDIVIEEKNLNIKKKSLGKKLLLFFLFLCVLFYLYIRFVEPSMLVVHEYAIIDNQLPSSFHGMKIVHFSDILYGTTMNEKNLEKVVQNINNLNPDVVLFTGDSFNSNLILNDINKQNLKNILSKIKATYRKYAIIGDNDYIDKNTFMDIWESADFMVLNNTYDVFYYKGPDPLVFIGTNSLLEKENDIALANHLEEEIKDAYKIWLNHEPSIIDELYKTSISPNLIFAGHHLSGLINMPILGYLLKQEGIKSYTGTYFQNGSTQMYVSSGLGTYKYNIRFLNPPSINLYRLYQY